MHSFAFAASTLLVASQLVAASPVPAKRQVTIDALPTELGSWSAAAASTAAGTTYYNVQGVASASGVAASVSGIAALAGSREAISLNGNVGGSAGPSVAYVASCAGNVCSGAIDVGGSQVVGYAPTSLSGGLVVQTTAAAAATATASGTSGASTGMLMINTPASLIQCQPAAITFSGGVAPYFLSVLPGGQSAAAPLESLPNQSSAGSYTWNTNIAAGTSVTLSVRDSTGNINYSSPLTILAGTSNSCLSS